jgi:arylsulfatase A-like enzyme
MALRFLERRDPTVPFFLKVSFFHPHSPFTPPRYYFDKYMSMDIPEPVVADWATVFDAPARGLPVKTRRISLKPESMRECRAGYYGCITHVDHQIGRILYRLDDPSGRDDWQLSQNTVVIFLSDHGEMLGDHQWMKKSQAYEPSARIPFLMRFPESMGIDGGQVRDEVVELMDVMPTLLDLAGVPITDAVDGRSVMPLLRGEASRWREYLHGQCSHRDETGNGMQYLTDGRWKFAWYPTDGSEQLFDLENDPTEMVDLSSDPQFEEQTAKWRAILARELEGRPEGFSDGEQLVALGQATPRYLPGFGREERQEWRMIWHEGPDTAESASTGIEATAS